MSTENAVATREQFSQEQTQLLKDTVCKGASDNELNLFMQVCHTKKLDPFSKQIYAIKRWDPDTQRELMTFQTGIDGFRVIAERSAEYAGQSAPLWCGDDGAWKDVWLSSKPPAAAKVSVHRRGFNEPLTRVAKYAEYVQTKKDKTPTRMWATMPANQLAKCAEALALRAAFPEGLSGLYVKEEMDQADTGAEEQPKRGSRASAQSVAETKIKALEAGATPAEASAAVSGIIDGEFEEVPVMPAAAPTPEPKKTEKKSSNFTMLGKFGEMKKAMAAASVEGLYYTILAGHGFEHSNEILNRDKGLEIYRQMERELEDRTGEPALVKTVTG